MLCESADVSKNNKNLFQEGEKNPRQKKKNEEN